MQKSKKEREIWARRGEGEPQCAAIYCCPPKAQMSGVTFHLYFFQMKTLPMIGKNCPRVKNLHENRAQNNIFFTIYKYACSRKNLVGGDMHLR